MPPPVRLLFATVLFATFSGTSTSTVSASHYFLFGAVLFATVLSRTSTTTVLSRTSTSTVFASVVVATVVVVASL